MIVNLPSEPGTYCLVFHCSISSSVTIGKLGTYQVKPGYYCYIGSAFGKGGLKSRINRHLQINKRNHWHLDYLRPHFTPVEIYYSTDTIKLECIWAKLLLEDEQSHIPIKKFGSSDCHCPTHLFYYQVKPELKTFLELCATIILQSSVAQKVERPPTLKGKDTPPVQ